MHVMPQGLQGLQVPVPDDDFDRAPTTNLVCRAASNPAPAGTQQMDTCAGDSSQHHLQNLFQYISKETSNKSAGSSSLVHEVLQHRSTFLQHLTLRPLMDHLLVHLGQKW